MVADDERDIAGLLALNLEMAGYEVHAAHDGQAALEAIQRELPDFVLLDVMMPRMDGFEVLRRLKADPETCDIPVIMLTAKAGDADVWRGWEAGASYYVTKPFDLEEVLRYLSFLEGNDPLAELTGIVGDVARLGNAR